MLTEEVCVGSSPGSADISIGCLMVSCQFKVVIGVVMLIVNLTQSGITRGKSLNEELFRLGWPAGMPVKDLLNWVN